MYTYYFVNQLQTDEKCFLHLHDINRLNPNKAKLKNKTKASVLSALSRNLNKCLCGQLDHLRIDITWLHT